MSHLLYIQRAGADFPTLTGDIRDRPCQVLGKQWEYEGDV